MNGGEVLCYSCRGGQLAKEQATYLTKLCFLRQWPTISEQRHIAAARRELACCNRQLRGGSRQRGQRKGFEGGASSGTETGSAGGWMEGWKFRREAGEV